MSKSIVKDGVVYTKCVGKIVDTGKPRRACVSDGEWFDVSRSEPTETDYIQSGARVTFYAGYPVGSNGVAIMVSELSLV